MEHTSTTSLHPSHSSLLTWGPVLLGLAVIAGESTQGMGHTRTDHWLLAIANIFHPTVYSPAVEAVNQALRKSGHFLGYGLLGLVFARAWFPFLHRRLVARWSQVRLYAALSGIASVFLVASADEIHQLFLPDRGGCFKDVCIDTLGAMLINAIFFAWIVQRRKHMIGVRTDQRMRAHFTKRMARIAIHRVRTGRSPLTRSSENAA